MPPRFVELIRVSGDAQEARDTPEDQRRALDRLRETRPGTFVERIDLGAVSGAADKRPDLERLFALAGKHAFDELRVRHLDRLTRHDDLRQRAEIFGRMLDAGAVIVDGSGHVIDPTTEMGELDYSLQTWMSAKERRRILERTLAARKRLAGEGKIQGRPPYARTWDKRTGTWGEDAAAMATYRRIFAEVLAGRSLAEIAEGLNDDGSQTPLGRRWSSAHVSRLVRHRSAIGVVAGWGRLFRCPAVIDEPTWRAALAAVKRHGQQKAGPPGHHPALLRRVLVCGACGSRMWVQRGGRAGDVRSYYVCSTSRRATDPDCRRWHAVEAVDEEVRSLVMVDLRQPERHRAAASREAPADAAAGARREAERATRELRDLDRQEERLARLIRKGLIGERTGSQQLAEVARLRNAAEVELNAATARAEALANAQRESADLSARAAKVAAGLGRADFATWVAFIRAEFPAGCSIRLYADGRIVLSGLRTWGRATGAVRALR